MSIYDELGIKRVINACATVTRLGGSIMPPEVIAAMEDASRAFVDLEELQTKVGATIAAWTHNEAAYVCAGAASGIVLSVAACITGSVRAAMEALPATGALPKDEIIVLRAQRNGWFHTIGLPGVRLVEVGSESTTALAEVEAAIGARTAALVWFAGPISERGNLSLEQAIAACRARGVPVLVDAAAQLPPVDNLWRFTQMGAACAIFSGGKDLRGPQASGLIVGRKSLVDAVRPQGNPNLGIGRPMKVGKEEMAGLLAAVRRYVEMDHVARRERDERVVAEWCRAMGGLPGVTVQRAFPNEAGQPLPRCYVTLGEGAKLPQARLLQMLLDGNPAIAVGGAPGGQGFYLNPMTLTDVEAGIVAKRLIGLLS